jgi:hypothetical protein
MIHIHWHSIIRHDYGVLCGTSGRHSWRVMLSQWLRIMLCYNRPVVVNNGESCCAVVLNHMFMLSQWLWNMANHVLPVVVNHHIHWHSIIRHDSQSLAKHCTTWFTTTGTSWLAIIHNHWLSITQHDSQTLAQYNSPWFTTTSWT